MIILRVAFLWFCLISTTSSRPPSFKRPSAWYKGSFLSTPVKFKRQADGSHPRCTGIEKSGFGDKLPSDESSDESMHHINKDATVAEMFRKRLMACGLITTKSPERWRDRLVAELDEIITDLEHRCALCKTLYDERRYEFLRSLIDPCPSCFRKNAKKSLLFTLQKVLEKSLDNDNAPEYSDSIEEKTDDDNETNDSNNRWHFTDAPKSRKTRSTTELPIDLTTKVQTTHSLQSPSGQHNFANQWWLQQRGYPITSTTIRYNGSDFESSGNSSSHSIDDEVVEQSSGHFMNGQLVDNVHEFLQQYMNLVYGGQPGNEQRRQFFLEQLCRNATNGRIVLQCKDITGHRKVRSPEKELQTWDVAESSNAGSDDERPFLLTTTAMNAVQPDYLGGRSCWCFGRTNQLQWKGLHL